MRKTTRTIPGSKAERPVDPVTDSWATGPDLPGPAVENPAAAALDGKLYVFGGSTGSFTGAVGNAAVFDPEANEWTALPELPTPRGGATAQAIGGKIYVVGGIGAAGAAVSTVEIFAPGPGESGAWSTATPLGTRRDNAGSAVMGGKASAAWSRSASAGLRSRAAGPAGSSSTFGPSNARSSTSSPRCESSRSRGPGTAPATSAGPGIG